MATLDLVSFALAKAHLVLDHDEDDSLVAIYISIASAVVLDYIKQDPAKPRTELQSLPVPDPVTGAYTEPTTWPYPLPNYASGLPSAPITLTWWPTPMIAYQNLPPFILEGWMDTSGSIDPALVPKQVQIATLLVLGVIYKDREGQTDPITPAVKSLLSSFYQPSCA